MVNNHYQLNIIVTYQIVRYLKNRMSQSCKNRRKPHFGPNLWSKWAQRKKHPKQLDFTARNQNVQYQNNHKSQSCHNGRKPHFGPKLGPNVPSLGQIFFHNQDHQPVPAKYHAYQLQYINLETSNDSYFRKWLKPHFGSKWAQFGTESFSRKQTH